MSTPQRPAQGEQLARVVRFFETLTPDDLARIEDLYAPDACFRDPFTEVRGPAAIARVFAHMFDRLDQPRFVVRDAIAQGDQAFLTWDMAFRFRDGRPAGPQTIHGGSHLRFDARGRIAWHRDYWDAAGELYEKLPVLGGLMRWLKRRAAG